MGSTAMLTVGLGGGSCTGKTSIARQLLDLLPSCVVLHQDSYYRKEDEPGHVLHPGTSCIGCPSQESRPETVCHDSFHHFSTSCCSFHLSGITASQSCTMWVSHLPLLLIEIDETTCSTRRQ